MAKGQLVHYGNILKLNMEEKGISKQFVMKVLNIKHNTTLDERIKDARFSYDQLRILREKDLI